MILSNLLTLTLLIVSPLVRGSPLAPRGGDDVSSKVADFLRSKGLHKSSDIYEAQFKTDGTKELRDTLDRKLPVTLLIPDDETVESSNLPTGDALNNFLAYSLIFGTVEDGFTAPGSLSRRTPNQNHLGGSSGFSSPGLGGSGGRRWNNLDDKQIQFIDQSAIGMRKRWDPVLKVQRAEGVANVKEKLVFKNIHILVIDKFLTLPAKVSENLCKSLLSSAPNGFVKLGQLLQKADLMDRVDTGKRITIFTPIDSAFDGIDIDKYSSDDLVSLLKNHFFFGKVLYSAFFPKTPKAEAESGKELCFTYENGVAYVQCGKSKAQVLRSDVVSGNGVMHVIDAPLKCDY
ncbi:hypothetical protein FRC12_025094 [Ceratobasidium sp. 428]|nr:hypothetical protein FRC12_025094 [Ceratobasidium sp. 428]